MAYHVRVLAGPVDRGAGSHVYHMELVRRLAERGHRVSLVCFSALPDVAKGVEVHTIPLPPPMQTPLLWRFISWRNAMHCARAMKALPLEPADVVVGGEHLFLKPHHRRFPQTPWLYLAHSLLVDEEIRSYKMPRFMQWVSTTLYVRLQKWALRHADRTLRFTQMACDALTKRYGIQARYFIDPIGIDLPAEQSRPTRQGPVRLLWVGQLIARKRIDLALAALGGMTADSWVFDVVGDGSDRGALEQQAQRLGLADRVRWHGFQKDPSTWYRQADLLLFPSWLENFPVTMLEAMSHGVPCLSMRGDGVRYHTANAEMVEHGRTGFLADSDEDFKKQLAELVRHPETLEATGVAARESVASRYTWEQHLDKLEKLFGELLQR